MRIDRLDMQNFKKFAEFGMDLDPHFTLLVGNNGSGKTSVLDGLAVALGIWLTEITDTTLVNSRRSIVSQDIRLEFQPSGDRGHFQEHLPVVVTTSGSIGDISGISWTRKIQMMDTQLTFDFSQHAGVDEWSDQLQQGKRQTSDVLAREAKAIIQEMVAAAEIGDEILLPVIGYYGAGRAFLPSNKRKDKKESSPVRRWSAFYDCFNERIRIPELTNWFNKETTAAGNRQGRMRPGFEAVKQAILQCVPGATGIWFDGDREEIVLLLNGIAQPFSNLSAGQRMMLALVADISIKAVTQNSYLLPPDELQPEDTPLPRVLRDTPGVILIDELDVHLHPLWQRRVASDLKRTFPSIQFVCTSHSPQIIGELKPEEIRILNDDGSASVPPRSFGIDSSRILEEVMDGKARNQGVEEKIHELSRAIDDEDFAAARQQLAALEELLDPNDPDVTHHRALLNFMETPLCDPS